MMKKFVLLLALFAMACGDDGDSESSDPLSCDWESPQLVPADPPVRPTGQGGDLDASLQGKWQHTFIVPGPGMIDRNEEGTDLRYMFHDGTLNFCQNIEGVIGPDSNEARYTLDGNTIDLGVVTYTALVWNEDVMILNNDSMGDQQYILQRR